VFPHSATTVEHLSYAYVGVWAAYFGFASSQFFREQRFLSALKGVLAVALAQIVVVIVVSALASLLLLRVSSPE